MESKKVFDSHKLEENQSPRKYDLNRGVEKQEMSGHKVSFIICRNASSDVPPGENAAHLSIFHIQINLQHTQHNTHLRFIARFSKYSTCIGGIFGDRL